MKILSSIRTSAVCLVAAAVMCAAGPVWAQPAAGPGGEEVRKERVRRDFAEMFEKMQLSAEQKARLDANRERHKGEMEALRQQMRDKRKELSAALEQPAMDISKVRQVHGELKELMLKKEDQHLSAILEIRGILTPEQFAQFQQMDRRGRKHGRPRTPPDGTPGPDMVPDGM